MGYFISDSLLFLNYMYVLPKYWVQARLSAPVHSSIVRLEIVIMTFVTLSLRLNRYHWLNVKLKEALLVRVLVKTAFLLTINISSTSNIGRRTCFSVLYAYDCLVLRVSRVYWMSHIEWTMSKFTKQLTYTTYVWWIPLVHWMSTVNIREQLAEEHGEEHTIHPRYPVYSYIPWRVRSPRMLHECYSPTFGT